MFVCTWKLLYFFDIRIWEFRIPILSNRDEKQVDSEKMTKHVIGHFWGFIGRSLFSGEKEKEGRCRFFVLPLEENLQDIEEIEEIEEQRSREWRRPPLQFIDNNCAKDSTYFLNRRECCRIKLPNMQTVAWLS